MLKHVLTIWLDLRCKSLQCRKTCHTCPDQQQCLVILHHKKSLSAHRLKLASLLEKQPHLHVPQIFSFLVLMLYKIPEYQCHLKQIQIHKDYGTFVDFLNIFFFMFSKSNTDDNNNYNNNYNNNDDNDDDDDITTKLICVTVNISTYTYIHTYLHTYTTVHT